MPPAMLRRRFPAQDFQIAKTYIIPASYLGRDAIMLFLPVNMVDNFPLF
jgi:hypothetical protein